MEESVYGQALWIVRNSLFANQPCWNTTSDTWHRLFQNHGFPYLHHTQQELMKTDREMQTGRKTKKGSEDKEKQAMRTKQAGNKE